VAEHEQGAIRNLLSVKNGPSWSQDTMPENRRSAAAVQFTSKPSISQGPVAFASPRGILMADETVVRRAVPEDKDTWARLRTQLWPTCSIERHRLEIDQLLGRSGLVALAIVAGKPVGFAELSIRHDHVEGTTSAPVPYLEGWYVAAPHRGKGVGTSLLGFIEQWARDQGYVEIASDVRDRQSREHSPACRVRIR
jgi:aminoglycoside 6'-N-acetyltransferase I